MRLKDAIEDLIDSYIGFLNEKTDDILKIDFSKGINVNINLIPWNPVPGLNFEEPEPEEVRNFVRMLENANLNVTLRTKRGRKIGGACGQLGKTLSDKIVEGKKLSGSKKYGNGED